MMSNAEELALLSFCKLLRARQDSRAAADLAAALAAIELVMSLGRHDAADFMAHLASVVTGIRITIADPDQWPAQALH